MAEQRYAVVAINEPISPEGQDILAVKALKHILHNVKHALGDRFSTSVGKKN